MEHQNPQSINQSMDVVDDTPAIASQIPASTPSSESLTSESMLIPQSEGEPCPTCGGAAGSHSEPSFVYALGKVEWRFPKQSVEKEFAQAIGRNETAGQTDREAVHTALTQRQNRYLLRQLCWVLTIEGLETYILAPRDPADLDLLVEAARPPQNPLENEDIIAIVIGQRGPIAPPELCNGLMVPIVVFDQIYSFDRSALIRSIPRPDEFAAESFTNACDAVFGRLMQMADNAGATDEHRALNYCAVRYPAIYAKAAESYERSCSLTAVEVRPSRLSGTRKIVNVIFAYTNRSTDVTDKFFTRVDVTEEFPFLVTKMSPYYDR